MSYSIEPRERAASYVRGSGGQYPRGEDHGRVYLGISGLIALSSHRSSTPKSKYAITPSSFGP